MEIELFVHFAEIAGVFVGFGALISLRSANVTDVHDVVYVRGVLMLGVWVVVAALVPIVIAGTGSTVTPSGCRPPRSPSRRGRPS